MRGTQTVQSKYRLELELMKPAKVRGKEFERYTWLYGFVSFQPNRTLLHITHIGTMEVSLKAYDKQDGSEGIYTVNSFRAEATKEAVTQTIGDINIPTMGAYQFLATISTEEQSKSKSHGQ
ncbi:conjugative transposon protein TraM [Neptunitalea lumnitzerae]|uniref:conjugative transposon protein TraM n=1 Tax=Neptunitalea lumnitzerae TaxID=2965509 RepID=UPI00248FE1CB|nr:conjugative transposon protein TraM [Neptunitalea sp. Y10]